MYFDVISKYLKDKSFLFAIAKLLSFKYRDSCKKSRYQIHNIKLFKMQKNIIF